MKKVLLVALSLLMITPVVQAKDKEEEVKVVLVKEDNSDNYYYEEVVPVESVTKEEMFKRAKDWVLSKLKTADNNIQFDEQNLSIYNSSVILLENSTDVMNFKISIYFKDGKYKFRIDNVIVGTQVSTGLYTKPYGPNMFAKWYSKKVMKKCNAALYSLTADLENAIKGTGTKKDDW